MVPQMASITLSMYEKPDGGCVVLYENSATNTCDELLCKNKEHAYQVVAAMEKVIMGYAPNVIQHEFFPVPEVRDGE